MGGAPWVASARCRSLSSSRACRTCRCRRLADVAITSDTFGGLTARALGPATPSGRIAAIDAVGGSGGTPTTIYVGAASGGVWKSADGGVTFHPIFDDQIQSIGAIRVDPSNPKTIWVGTGESWTRNSVSVGDGVWKSTDGGDTWTQLGLRDSERIARIHVDPKKADTAWVCATGQLWNPNDERGVYKTTDGGKTWKKTLWVDADTGCSDLAIDPGDASILYAGMWQFRRGPDYFNSGGKGSGLWKSTDGGETWRKVEKGLPTGDKGRIGIAIAPSRPNVVYAVVEAKKTALYRSDDTGESWREVNGSMNVAVRPFYFAHLVVDPKDHDVVYKPGLFLTISRDGGKSFSNPIAGFSVGSVHSDHHALWAHPERPNELLLGTDGGLYLSYDRGGHWLWAKNLPIAQFYHVSYDLEIPYNVYGGLQDNGSWTGPSRSIGGIEGRDWQNIGVGDGFWAFVDPKDSDYVYSEYQGGNLMRANRVTGEVRAIKPYAESKEKLRFNWNTALQFSPHEKGTLYYGAQYLFRSLGSRRDLGAHLGRPDDQRSAAPAAGHLGRPDARQLDRREQRHDLRDLRITARRGSDLGGHRRRSGAGHQRLRQDLDQCQREPPRAAQGRLGVERRGVPFRRRRRAGHRRPPPNRRQARRTPTEPATSAPPGNR